MIHIDRRQIQTAFALLPKKAQLLYSPRLTAGAKLVTI